MFRFFVLFEVPTISGVLIFVDRFFHGFVLLFAVLFSCLLVFVSRFRFLFDIWDLHNNCTLPRRPLVSGPARRSYLESFLSIL